MTAIDAAQGGAVVRGARHVDCGRGRGRIEEKLARGGARVGRVPG